MRERERGENKEWSLLRLEYLENEQVISKNQIMEGNDNGIIFQGYFLLTSDTLGQE